MTPLKTIRTTLVSVIFRQFGRCFGLFDTAGSTKLINLKKDNLHSLLNRIEKLAKDSPFYLFLKLVQINMILSDNVRIFFFYIHSILLRIV